MFDNEFEVLIIGGGINGVGVARDCCLRGLRTGLIEANDFASGATGASSGLIHGGPRYLLEDIHTTRTSCLDSGFIQQLSPQMLFRVPFLVPWFKGAGILPELMDTFFSAYDHFAKLKNGKPHLRLTRQDCFSIEPGLNEGVQGAVTFDEWGVNPMRLTYLNLLDAHRNGLEAWNHMEVVEFIEEPGADGLKKRIKGVKARSKDGTLLELKAHIVVNLTGPWVSTIGKLAGVEIEIRPSKGVHLVLDRRYTNTAITAEGIDGRDQMFILPHESTTLLGATDDDYFGDPGNIQVTDDEVNYILDAARSIVPSIAKARVIRAFAGVRPTLHKRGVMESDLSREHLIIDHQKEDGVEGLITMLGGKLAAYRLMSQECTDLIMQKLERKEPCTTHQVSLPGGENQDQVDLQALKKKFQLPLFALSRLKFRFGSELERVLEEGEKDLGPLSRSFACPCEPVTFAEAKFSLKHEWCQSLNDLRRRTRFGMGPCGGTMCTIHGANLLAEEQDLDFDQWHAELVRFLEQRFAGREMGLFSSESAKQEELFQCMTRYSAGIDEEPLRENILGRVLGGP